METGELNHYAARYKAELLDNIIPFWTKHSPDMEHGGYYTCLSREGDVFDTDKFIWLQARQVWLFAMLYNEVSPKTEWLHLAIDGAEFLKKHGRDTAGNWYFSLTREGKPLVQPYNIFSDCFAAMAFGELYKACKSNEYRQIAVDTFHNILKRRTATKGIYEKQVPGTRPMTNFALPMILCNLSLILEDVVGNQSIEQQVTELADTILSTFYQKESGLILENVSPEGLFVDSFEGRLLNPGHSNESMWFLMDIGTRFNRPELIQQATNILLRTTEYGWDKQHGGLFYFLDIKGHPTQQLEWDQKLWWVHLETLIALAKAYKLTGNTACRDWFETVQEYSWKHFKDPNYGEWFGYLNRQGEPLLTLKGGKWKGCFHVPRAMFQLWRILEA